MVRRKGSGGYFPNVFLWFDVGWKGSWLWSGETEEMILLAKKDNVRC